MTFGHHLNNCYNSLDTLFKLAKEKQQWDRLYPELVSVATQIENLFILNQQLSIAQFAIYDINQDYAVNLLTRQCLLICVLGKLAGYNRIATVKIIQSAIAQLITIRDELNTVSNGKKLSVIQRKHYQQRFRASYVLFKAHFAKLPLVQTDLSCLVKQTTCHSEHTSIIRLSYAIAKNITHTKTHKAKSLRESIALIYLNVVNQNDKSLLTSMASLFTSAIPGEQILLEDRKYRVLGVISDKKLLCFDTLNESYLELDQTLEITPASPLLSKNTDRYNRLWEKLPELYPTVKTPYINEYFSREDLIAIRKAVYLSVGKLLNEINKNPNSAQLIVNLTERVCDKKSDNIRHAIALLGVEQLPDLLENQQLLQRLSAMGKLNWSAVLQRLNTFIRFVESYKKIDIHFPCQKAINFALKYLAFILKLYPHGVILPINTKLPNASFSLLNTLLHFYSIHKVTLPEQIKSNPFFQISETTFDINNASTMQCVCFVHITLINAVYLGFAINKLPLHTQQQLNIAANTLGIESLDNYLDNLLSFNPSTSLL